MMRKTSYFLCLLIAGIGALLAASLPTSAPVHRGLSHGELLGYIADSTQRMQTGSGVATLPVAGPAHAGMSQGELLGYIADYTQDLANRGPVFHVSYFGAFPDDGIDDRLAFQNALDAAETTRGKVQMSAGLYNITTINSPAAGDKAGGAIGIEIPSYVTLSGVGRGSKLRIVAGGAWGVGCGISPKGMRTCTTNFGAASNWTLQDFEIDAPEQADSSGNLINIVHASDWRMFRIHMGGSLHHGLELDQTRRGLVEDCTWSGSYSGGSGSWIQMDKGLAGPVNRPATITTNSVEDVSFVRCYGASRPSTDTGDRDVDINHAPSLTLTRIKFTDCLFEGRARNESHIAGIDDNAAVVDGVTFEGCRFVTQHYGATAFYFSNGTATVRQLAFTGCDFSGPSARFIYAGGNTSPTYNATHTQRQSITVENCAFRFDKTQMPTTYDVRLLSVIGWVNATVRNNYFRGIGDFPVSVGTIYCYITLAANNLATSWTDNFMYWEGNNTFSVGRTAMAILTSEADNAGIGMGAVITGNRVYSVAGTGMSYCVFHVAGSSSVAARRGHVFAYNFGNGANTGDNNCIVTGVNTGSTFTVGSAGVSSRNVTANTTLTPQDQIVNCDTTSGSITITPPNVLHRQQFRVRKTSAANSLIMGSTTVTANNAMILGWSDGTTFYTVPD